MQPAFVRSRPLLLVSLVVTLIGGLISPWARGAKPAIEPASQAGAITFVTDRVVVFKDGYGLFIKEGTGVADGDGRVVSGQVPEAVLGTFWATGEGQPLRSTTASWLDGLDKQDSDGDCQSPVELLRANPGKLVTLHFEQSDVTGRIVKVLDDAMVVLDDTPGGRLVLATTGLLSLSGKELSTQCQRHTETPRRSKQLTFDFGPGAARKAVKLHLIYFSPGVRWLPTYRVETGDERQAKLALQAELLNEAEDLKDTTLDLVVGVPNFRFKDTASPLSLETVMRQALAQAAPYLATQMMNNSMTYVDNNSRQRSEPDASAPVSVMDLAPNMASEGHQDLFTYTTKGITLAKGARMALPLWAGSAAPRHLYTVDIPLVHGSNGLVGAVSHGARQGGSPLKLEANEVWHQLELVNGSEQPWTTGAALVMQGLLPLAQETLGYTSPGARTLLPLTVAVDLRSGHEEHELDRKVGATVLDKRSFTLLHKQGTVTLTNHRRDRSTVRVDLHTGGKVDAATESGRVTVDEGQSGDWSQVEADPRLTHHSDVSWELTLAPGETKTLTYTLSLYE
jgi:hypothetical protein